MSALAKLMLIDGKKVTGSDLNYTDELCALNQWGAEIWVGHEPERVKGAELVVYTAAVPETDPELVKARELGIPTVMRHHFLGEVAKDYGYVIAVSGTHGKTTTTGLIANIFRESGESFTAHIGGELVDGGNLVYRGRDFFISEACEYKKSLLTLTPDIGVVLNVERDHPDTYPTIGELYDAFDKFLMSVKKDGAAVLCGETEYYRRDPKSGAEILSYGFEGCRYSITKIEEYGSGYYSFRLTGNGETAEIKLPIPGFHNIYNASAAFIAARKAGISPETAIKGIENFKGVKRRFEAKGKLKGAKIFVDYAHHPSQIKTAIAAAEAMRPERLITVFQPHTYSRTKQLYEEFLESFKGSDALYIFKEYAARETPDKGASAYDLYAGLKAAGETSVYYHSTLMTLAPELAGILKKRGYITDSRGRRYKYSRGPALRAVENNK